MAGNSQPPPPSAPPPVVSNNPDPTQYWCYHCNKHVPVETLPDHPDVICFECKNGFVESISRATDEDTEENPAFGNEFLHILRLIALAAREDDEGESPPPPSDRPAGDNDYLRTELDGWNSNVSVEHDPNPDSDPDLDQGEQVRAQFEDEHEDDTNNRNESEDDDVNNDEFDDDEVRRDRRDVLRLRLRDFASRAASRRNRILDWAEILMGLEDESVEFRLRVNGIDDTYMGNPGDYVDAAGYEELLQTLAESDNGGRRGAPPAAKSAVEGLRTVEVNSLSNSEICAICKESVVNNEGKIVKQLECGHMYHGDCIVLWLDSKNSCPVCRFELPTDDPEYEEEIDNS